MKIAMCQNNYIVGDFSGNLNKIINNCEKNKNADLIVFSELCLSGYYPWDLIYRDSFIYNQEQSLNQLLEYSKNIKSHIVIGIVKKHNNKYYNSLNVIHNGEIVFDYQKKLLPTYNIFDEKRHFTEGQKSGIFKINNVNIGFLICEDAWNDEKDTYITNPIEELINNKAQMLISINASPFNIFKIEQRDKIFTNICKKYNIPFVYVNQTGSNDDIVFDGSSFVINNNGEKLIQLKSFEEDNYLFDTDNLKISKNQNEEDKYSLIFKSLKTGLTDYLQKQGFNKVVVGCSGGVDSALVLALCSLYLGSDNVKAITMPSKYSSKESVSDSVDLCNNLKVELLSFPIKNEFDNFINDFVNNTNNNITGLAKENLQARIRGTILMTYSNQNGNLLINTSNKSESAVGYSTLYGDSCGAIGLISDLYKTEIFEFCKWINKNYNNIIPNNIIEKAPSAELSEGQKDSDSLPEYEILDAIIKKELEWDFLDDEQKNIINNTLLNISEQEYSKVLKLIDKSEFKRKQSPLGIRIHPLAFGSGRRVPIVHKTPVNKHIIKNKLKFGK